MDAPISAPPSLDPAWTLICATLVFVMQAGFVLLEGGVVRSKNSINVAVKNLLDCVVSFTVFGLFGFGIMFGADVMGFVGTPGSIDLLTDSKLITFFLFQLVFCSTATTVLSGAVAERTKLSTFLIAILIVSGLIYPLVGHWIWGGTLPGSGQGWLAALGFHDFAGATVVHVVGGFAALAATQSIGPRRFIPESTSTGGYSLVLSVLGCFLIWFGWWGFNGGSLLGMTSEVPLVLLNTQIGAAAGGVISGALCFALRRRVEVMPLISGVIAGLVSVTAACDIMSPGLAALAGAGGATLAYAADAILKRCGIDDVVSAFPVHGVAGVWGTIIASFTSAGPRFAVQLLGTLVVAMTTYAVVRSSLEFAKRWMSLRVTEEEEIRGLNVVEHGATNALIDLVGEMENHRAAGDFSEFVTVEPHTESGQIAAQYNRVIERVQKEIGQHEQTTDWLKSERLRLQSVLENVDVGIYQLDSEFRFTTANSALLSILGYRTTSELIQRDPTPFPPWLEGTEHEDLCRESLSHGHAIRDLETKISLPDGREIWVLESLIPVRNDEGELLTWLGTLHDITARKQAMLAEVEIAQAKSEAKGEFLANMSHEIRTPLNGVIGTLDLLAAGSLEEQEAHYVSIARDSADSLLSIINDVLDFSKIEAGRMDLEHIEFDLREVVESTSEQFAIRAHSAGLELNCDIKPEAPSHVIGDPERLRQVLTNLLGNALKFTRSGEINVRVQPEGGGISFAVEDTGIGMSPEQCRNIFESFTQADSSTTREYGGTGLGLSISNKLVQLMGGQIETTSEEGKGSCFSFTLSLPVSHKERLSDNRIQELLDRFPETRILIVDDNATNCEILKRQMESWRFRAEICQCSESAVDRMTLAHRAGEPFDLVLLDYCMPVLDGSDVARLIRANPSLVGTPIIMLSSNHELMSRQQREEVGIDVAMTKPVRQSRLFDSIVNLLEKRLHALPEASPFAASTTVASSNPVRTETYLPASNETDTANASIFVKPRDPVVPSVATQPGDRIPRRVNQGIDILIAEDNEINQIVVRQMLTSLGYTAEVATNGAEAIAKLQAESYQAVLMDGHMPVMDGLTATATIRRLQKTNALPLNASTPVIALTANVNSEAKQEFMQAGVRQFLSKPVTLHRLEEALIGFTPTAGNAGEDSEATNTPQDVSLPASVSNLIEEIRNPDAPMAAEAIYDEADFIARCGGDEAFRRHVLSIMQSSLPITIADLRESSSQQNFEKTARIAHRLKGAATDSALVAVGEAAAAVEAAAREALAPEIADSLGELERRVSQTLNYLESHLT